MYIGYVERIGGYYLFYLYYIFFLIFSLKVRNQDKVFRFVVFVLLLFYFIFYFILFVLFYCILFIYFFFRRVKFKIDVQIWKFLIMFWISVFFHSLLLLLFFKLLLLLLLLSNTKDEERVKSPWTLNPLSWLYPFNANISQV